MAPTNKRIIKRSALYRLVWQESIVKLAPGFGLSDVGLRKACLRADIPLPPRGYWAKVGGGRVPKTPPLPRPSEDWDMVFDLPPEAAAEEKDEFDATFTPLIEDEARPERRITIPDGVGPLSSMAQAVGKKLRSAKPDKFGGLVCAIPSAIRVRVPAPSIDRAIGIVDALAKAFEARGLSIRPGVIGERPDIASVMVAGQPLRLSLEETSSRRTHRLTEDEKKHVHRFGYSSAPLYDFVPSGVMTLKIENARYGGAQSTWKDSTSRRLETRLNEVMVGLYRCAHAATIQQKRDDERRVRVGAENERRAALRAERDDELAFLERLEKEAGSWRRAEDIRAYAAAVETSSRADDADREIWLARARRLADRIDPLTITPRSPLDYDERDLRPLYSWQDIPTSEPEGFENPLSDTCALALDADKLIE